MATEKNEIHCTACKKVIGKIEYLKDGKLSIKCKCGMVNTLEATPPPVKEQTKNFIYNEPYQDRLNLVKKDDSEIFEIKRI